MDTSSPALKVVLPAYKWHTQMFDNLTKDISADHALKRVEGRTNHITWTVGNLVNCRYWLGNVLGVEEKDPHEDLFKDARALDPAAEYPSLDQLKQNWHTISKKVYAKLLTVTDAELSEKYEMGMNVEFMEENKLNMIGMGLDRCSYLLGQLALLRRAVANLGTSYDVNKELDY